MIQKEPQRYSHNNRQQNHGQVVVVKGQAGNFCQPQNTHWLKRVVRIHAPDQDNQVFQDQEGGEGGQHNHVLIPVVQRTQQELFQDVTKRRPHEDGGSKDQEKSKHIRQAGIGPPADKGGGQVGTK